MIMEVVKAMIHDQDLLMHLWEEVAQIVEYVQNKSPHSVLGKQDTRRNVYRIKTIGQPPKDIWLSSVCACSQR
jgi:hypothetical protein